MMWIGIGVGAAAVLVVGLLLARRRKGREPLVSIVMLRRARRGLTEADVRGVARRVAGPDIQVVTSPSPDPGTTSAYILVRNGAAGFFVIDTGRPYSDNAKAEAMKFEDTRAREAYTAHRAWVSVDVVGGMPPEEVRGEVLSIMAKLAAEFIDDQCTLLYAPAMERVALPGPATEAQLRNGDLSTLFGDDEVNTPITNVEAGDRRIERAMAEAKKQWPRFVEVWQRRGRECKGLVKGRFEAEGGAEYMWVEVSAASDGGATGVLVNEPAHVTGIKKGQTVKIGFSEVADWACVDGGKPLGMFVERILRGGV